MLIPLAWVGLLLAYCGPLTRLWREPVLRRPVLIIESDDWGPGPESHARALASVAACLERHHDATGAPAVMTLGLVLAHPDNPRIRESGFQRYARRTLLDPSFGNILDAIEAGLRRGVFGLQLHGLEHLWPASFMTAAADGPVREWIASTPGHDTEALPPPLQSRWVDGSRLPALPHPKAEVEAAAGEETALFRECFGETASVAVPPTFVWNAEVERAWAKGGVRTVITPGRRYTQRDEEGRPAAVDRAISNGQQSDGGQLYLVRDIYFEPSKGHKPEQVLSQIQEHFQLGRPALLETHRFNFTGSREEREKGLDMLDQLLGQASRHWPALRFVSSADLAARYREQDADWIDQGVRGRWHVWLQRTKSIPRFRKLAKLTGLALVGWLVLRLTGESSQAGVALVAGGSRS